LPTGTLHFCKILKLEIVLPIGEGTPLSLFLDSHTQPQASALGQALKSRKGLKLGSLPYIHKALPGFFLRIFQLHYLPEETCFKQAGSSAVEGTRQAVLGSSDQRKVPASLSLFLKSEKIPALLSVGKRTCVQALLLYV